MSDRVVVSIEGNLALVRLNRPEKHNALDHEAFRELIDAGEKLALERTVRAVVLAGAGESFCAGIDRSVLTGGDAVLANDLMLPLEHGSANFYQRAALVWRELPVPVIAAIHGVAFGAGLQVALGADIRIASPSARFSIMEIRWGIIPDMGISVTARNVLREDQLRLLACTGRTIDGTAALACGLVTELDDDPGAGARRLASELASRSPDALRALKSLLNASLGEPAEAALRREAGLQRSLFGTGNQREAVMANLQQREPHFADPPADRLPRESDEE